MADTEVKKDSKVEGTKLEVPEVADTNGAESKAQAATESGEPQDVKSNGNADDDESEAKVDAPSKSNTSEESTGKKSQYSKSSKTSKGEDSGDEADDSHRRRDSKPQRGSRNYDNKSRYQKKTFVKTDFSALPESSDPTEIRKQVEFYFSDSNLPHDTFLFAEVGGEKNNYVDIKTIHNFKRMKHFQPYSAVVDALKESDFLEVNDTDQVRRREPLVKDAGRSFEDKARPRSIYAKGFGEEGSRTQFEIESFFEPYGPINAVRLRRDDRGAFKGSVFVEFAEEAEQQQFLELDPKPKFNGKELQVMSKAQYCDDKLDAIRKGEITPNENRYLNNRGRGGHRGKYNDRRGGHRGRDRSPRNRRGSPDYGRRDKDDWKGRRDDYQKSKGRHGGRDNRDRNDRKRGRDDEDDGGRDRKRSRSPPVIEKDEMGVPIVKATTPSNSQKNGSVKEEPKPSSPTGKKRGRDEEGAKDGSPGPKRAKAEVEATA